MLKNILEMETKALFFFLKLLLQKEFRLPLIEDGDNYIFYHSPQNPLCLVAHMDTVNDRQKAKVKIEQTGQIIRNKHGILGADDRAGVYAILRLLYRCKKEGLAYPSVLFTNYEESGGIGVKTFLEDLQINPFEHTRLFIELDRENANHYVYYTWDLPEEIRAYAESFGFVEEMGTYSDIADLSMATGIPAINLSVGYYRQHTEHERLHIDELHLTINRVFDMLQNPPEKLYPVEIEEIYPDDLWAEDEEAGQSFDHLQDSFATMPAPRWERRWWD